MGTDTKAAPLLLDLGVEDAEAAALDVAAAGFELDVELVVEFAPAPLEPAAVKASVHVTLAPTLLSSVNTTSEHWYRCPCSVLMNSTIRVALVPARGVTPATFVVLAFAWKQNSPSPVMSRSCRNGLAAKKDCAEVGTLYEM